MVRVYTIIFLLFVTVSYFKCISEKIPYLSVEHPAVTYVNPKFFSFANLTSRRFGRRNPVYYVGLHLVTVVPLDNNVNVEFFFYQWLTNVYKPSFIEFHFKWCDLLQKDLFFGAAMRQGDLVKPCPHPPGKYNLYNMTINPAAIPRGFPFTRGRIYSNLTYGMAKERMGEGYIDMELKLLNKKDIATLFKT